MRTLGKFIAIEGSDGSGKGTHTAMLVEWLKKSEHDVLMVDFPQYGRPSAYFVEQYLNGQFGPLADIDAYKASLFYAVDRYDASFPIRQAIQSGRIVVANRYVASNMAHQGGKIADQTERETYIKWNQHIEYEILGIPKPDLNIVLSMPPTIATKLIDQKEARAYIKSGKRDIHEQDQKHLSSAYDTFLELCQLFPTKFVKVDCTHDSTIRSLEDIQSEVRAHVARVLK